VDEALVKEIMARLERLEKVVFAKQSSSAPSVSTSKSYKGATGGIRLLMEEGFFGQKRALGEVCEAAGARGYHYSKQAFHDALTRLSTKEKALVTVSKNGRKLYALRR